VPDITGRALEQYIGQTVTLGVRPEHLVERSRLGGDAPADATIPVKVDIVETLGNEIFVYLISGSVTLTSRMDPDIKLQTGQEIEVAAEPRRLHFFDPKTEQRVA
ncbi:MAG: TOBE domain-containing protein, partial [Chloroflexia bacterium]|nr:TOBE domain-containing protein [Chloroflexia bacterium]